MAQLQKFTNNASGTASTEVAIADTTIVLSTGQGAQFPSLTGSEFFMATLKNTSTGALEIVKVTARSTDTLTVTRAQESTTAQLFPILSVVELRPTAGTFDTLYTEVATKAVNGANSDITSLSGLTTPLSVAQGGTASTTASAARTALGLDSIIGTAGKFDFRNLLINSRGNINQRAYVSGTATTIANQYTVDRWRVVTSGQSLSWTTSGNVATFTAPADGVEQVIEGLNIDGGSHVINWTGTATCTVDGTARAKGESFTLTAGTNATVRFSGGTFSLPQVERGTTSTTHDARPYGVELSLCERYYSTGVGGAGSRSGDNLYFAYVQFKQTMRTTPTLTSSPTQTPAATTAQGSRFTSAGVSGGASEFTYTASAEL